MYHECTHSKAGFITLHAFDSHHYKYGCAITQWFKIPVLWQVLYTYMAQANSFDYAILNQAGGSFSGWGKIVDGMRCAAPQEEKRKSIGWGQGSIGGRLSSGGLWEIRDCHATCLDSLKASPLSPIAPPYSHNALVLYQHVHHAPIYMNAWQTLLGLWTFLYFLSCFAV